MEEEQKTSILTTVTPIVALIIGAAIGFIVGTVQSNDEISKLQVQIDTAKKFFPTTPEIRSLSGTIKDVSGNTITLESSFIVNPFENLPQERVITITPSTKLISFEPKDQAVFQKEMEEYSQKMSAVRPGGVREPAITPIPFNEKTLNINGIKVGMTVTVEAGENVKEKAAFEAVKITVTPVMPPVPFSSLSR